METVTPGAELTLRIAADLDAAAAALESAIGSAEGARADAERVAAAGNANAAARADLMARIEDECRRLLDLVRAERERLGPAVAAAGREWPG